MSIDNYINKKIVFVFIVSRVFVERFLSHLPHLKELELVCLDGNHSLCLAHEWENFIINNLSSLSIFNFKFQFKEIIPARDRDRYIDIGVAQFRNSFWINESRHWYVAFDRCISSFTLFTVPRFACHAIVDPHISILPDATTVPIAQHMIFYDHITELTLGSNNESLFQYRQVKMLTLFNFNIDDKMIDLSQVQYLSMEIPQQWSLHELIQLINTSMPRLHSLKLDSVFSIKSSAPVVPLVQIRTLYLSYFGSLLKTNDIDLSRFFPRVERLTTTVKTCRQMALLIDRFQHLSSGSFYVVNCQIGVKNNLHEPSITREWLIDNTQRLGKNSNNSFTCRFDRRHLFSLHLWISDDNGQQNKIMSSLNFSRHYLLLKYCQLSRMSLNDKEEETKCNGWRRNCLPRCSLQ